MSLKKDIYYNFFFWGGCQMKFKTFNYKLKFALE